MNSVTLPLVSLLKNLRRAQKLAEDASLSINWDDALSEGQLTSKMWLIDELAKLDRDLGNVFVLGGWIGVLPALMFYDERLRFDRIRSFDIDPTCWPIAEMINRVQLINQWRFKASTEDMFDLDYDTTQYVTQETSGHEHELVEVANTLINTSCDHIAPFSKWWDLIPAGKLVVLQNNDFAGADEDHVNTVPDLETMIAQAPMSQILFQGEKQLLKYKRFMLIGIK